MAVDREEIFDAIHDERRFQDEKWGNIDSHKHSVPEWLLIMKKLLEKAENDWMKSGDVEALKSVLKATATGVACIEQHGINIPKNRPRD